MTSKMTLTYQNDCGMLQPHKRFRAIRPLTNGDMEIRIHTVDCRVVNNESRRNEVRAEVVLIVKTQRRHQIHAKRFIKKDIVQ